MSHAVSDEQIELLATGNLTTHDSMWVQRHIYKCPNCLHRLIETTYIQELAGTEAKRLCAPTTRKPLSFVHHTADGFICSKVERRGSKWIARPWGDQLDGQRECDSMREANEYVVTSFQEMFPEHRCTQRCRMNGLFSTS